MMDRNYPTSSFGDPLAPPAQPVAWAYERSSATIKPSSSYGATQLESELLQRQNYTSSHQMPTYTTTPHPTGLSGVFDSGGITTETSIMNFLTAMESRSLQAGPASASLLPPFRSPSWPAGTNSSTTELYLTGALPSSATFPSPAALSSYQHVGAFPARSYAAATSSLGLQDSAFSVSANGLLPHHDPLLHLKTPQTVLPTALAFNHIPAPSLGTALPIQSSTYRSAQESAPHLLQPQFGLLPSALASTQGASQPYGAPVFSGSIERALQRECSVIKHHQRPSSSHAPPEQLPGSQQHPLQGYLGSGSETEVPFQQDPSRQTSVPCSPSANGDSASRGVNGGPTPKAGAASQTALQQQSQAYPSSNPSPGYSPSAGAKTKDCASKLPPLSSEAGGDGHVRPQGHPGASPESYPSPGQKQNSVIASQQSTQLPSLLSISHSQTYITSHSQSQATYSSTDKLPSLYKTLPSFSGQSANEATGSQSMVYSLSSGPGQEAHYVAQGQGLCLGNLSQNYTSSHSQGAPNTSYPSQSQGPTSAAKSYAVGQSLATSYPSSSSAGRTQPLSTANSTQGYVLMQPTPAGKADGGLSQQLAPPLPQTQKYLLPAPAPAFSSAAHAQALQNNVRPSQDMKQVYSKLKLEELPLQELQALQQAALDTSGGNMAAHNNVVYVVSKMDDRYNTQSVIRSNSRSEEQQQQLLGMGQTMGKDERMGPHGHGQLGSGANSHLAPETKAANAQLLSAHEELKQHSLLLKAPETQQQNHQTLTPRSLAEQNHSHNQAAQTQFIRVPNAQVLMEPNQMILLQQPLIHPGHNSSKVLSGHMQQGQGPVQVQYMQMDRELISGNANGSHGQQGAAVSHQGSGAVESKHLLPKDPYTPSTNQQSHDNKHQFTLNSICFPESMLLADERNILSNVDDILAATAAACGVTPQDFVKATSGADGDEMSAMANPPDSKGQFQTVDARHLSPGFSSSSQHSMVTSTDSSHTMALMNGGQMTADGQGRPGRPNNGSELHPDDRGGPESDYHLAGQGYDPLGLQHGKALAKGSKAIKREDGLMDCPSEGFPKKRARSKAPGPDDEDGQPRPGKRGGGGCGGGQAKRQNSRGSDTSSPSTSEGVYDGYQQQERIRQKLREVEEKQPEVKVGFMGSFLDFLKSGPKQHFSAPPARAAGRSRKPSSKQGPCTLPSLTHKLQPQPAPLLSQEGHVGSSQRKRLEEDLQRNLETLPSFSSDEEESVGKNWALQNSISSALSALDEPTDRRHRADTRLPNCVLSPAQTPSMPQPFIKTEAQQKDAPKEAEAAAREGAKETPPDQLAAQLTSVAIEGLTDEELSDSGGEGMYRERDEFVVRNEDIESLQVTLRAGQEPPAIWKVQKALLQKFVPELRDGRRVFSATNSYLGYFGDAKTMYRRVYVKFLDTVNKREYVRVCNRKPRCKPMHTMRGSQVKCLLGLKPAPPSVPFDSATPRPPAKPRPKQPRPRAEPPPKKRRKWKEEFSASPSESSTEEVAEDAVFNSQVPLGSRFLNTRTMKETFRSFVELLTSVALDADVMSALEQGNDELLLPHMKRVEGMITDNRKRLLPKLCMGQLFKAALDSFPEISVVTELKKDGETPAFKVRLSGRAYNRKTMKPSKSPSKLPLEYTVDQQKTQWFSLYHSLQHYKYHTYLMCKDEIASLRVQAGDLGQEQTVQLCMQNGAWVEGLFDRFGELLNQVQQACL